MAIQLKHLHPFTLHQLRSSGPPTHLRASGFRVEAVSGKELIQSGKVRAVEAKEAAKLMKTEEYMMLDIRPEWEREKARVTGSLHAPLFVQDMDNSIVTLLKKWVHFGYIGLWTGQYFTMINPGFLAQVEGLVSDKDTKLLVSCGEGLRSLMAVSKLYGAGYKNLGWLVGGFNRSVDGDFADIQGTEKLQYATIGGVSYYFLQILILLQAVGKDN
ncbi:hypothetical protein DCAR_0727537 [Daucus carota subsp. sativus]|uniref:Rhodanese domain-containing protein n=1 Tax=Daucus carota subsp. sativus TaxID=79200 RepID=A0A164T031_DAUCS|nr:PREDICTED: rhodanese-like domain-containing protein 10 [Daucus carota subsp. sativus]WOH08100.1 hypothetical protein DCAR_0727537 [Daucus carota subsp. sativus]